jgi:hypothetical protein
MLTESDKKDILLICNDNQIDSLTLIELIKFLPVVRESSDFYSGTKFFKALESKFPNLSLSDFHRVALHYSTWNRSYMWLYAWKRDRVRATIGDLKILAFIIDIPIDLLK